MKQNNTRRKMLVAEDDNDLYRRFIRSKDKDSSVWIVSVSHPLSAALSYLKYVYLTGFLMTLFCGIITAKQLQKSFMIVRIAKRILWD